MKKTGISAVIATRHRAEPLREMFQSLAVWGTLPDALWVVDASEDSKTHDMIKALPPEMAKRIHWVKAEKAGAAAQRNQGIQYVDTPYVWFVDDDVEFETDCLAWMLKVLEENPQIGGVNALSLGCHYREPSPRLKKLYGWANGVHESSYAGKCLTVGYNLMPEDKLQSGGWSAVDWLNTTCTLYRMSALPSPAFAEHFTGASIGEDLSLSLTVGRTWKLANVPFARYFHKNLGGDHKKNWSDYACMEIVNRHYIMKNVMGKRDKGTLMRFYIFDMLLSLRYLLSAHARGRRCAYALGRIRGYFKILNTASL